MISIIIVSYNSKKFILPCINSIKKYAPQGTEVIVVDNDSTDGSTEKLKNIKSEKHKFQLIENKKNVGFAKAVNQALRQAQGEYFFVLNPDTKITRGSMQELLAFTESHTDVGIVGPQLLNPDGSVQPSCYREPTLSAAVKEYFLGIKNAYGKYAPETKGPVRVDAVVGAAMFIPKSIVNKAGMLDERYFMYFEDLDFCRRVRHAGLSVYYLPTATVYHAHGGITRTVPEQARKWLIDSSKLYHGIVKHTLLTLILWLGQKWRKI